MIVVTAFRRGLGAAWSASGNKSVSGNRSGSAIKSGSINVVFTVVSKVASEVRFFIIPLSIIVFSRRSEIGFISIAIGGVLTCEDGAGNRDFIETAAKCGNIIALAAHRCLLARKTLENPSGKPFGNSPAKKLAGKSSKLV